MLATMSLLKSRPLASSRNAGVFFVYEEPSAKKQRALGKDAFDNIVTARSPLVGGKVPRNCGRSGPARPG